MRRASFLFCVCAVLAISGGAQVCDGLVGRYAGPCTNLQGRVEDGAGNPISGAQLQVFSANGAMLDTTSTSAGGEFRFDHEFADGAYQFKVSVQGHVFITQASHAGETVIQIPVSSRPQQKLISESVVSVNDLRVSRRARKNYEKAVREVQRNRYDSAARYVSAALTDAPQWSDALYLRGVLFLQENKPDEAARSFEAVLRSNPNHLMALTALGSTYETLNHYDQAEFYFKRAANQPRAPWQAWLELANLHLRQQKYRESENDAVMALKSDAEASPLCQYVLGQAAIAAADYPRAQSALDTFVRTAPQNPHASRAREQLAQLTQILGGRTHE